METATILVDMIRVSYRFENFLSHEKGIGKILDEIIEYPTDPHRRVALRKCFWEVTESYLENGIDEEVDIELIDIVKNIGAHLMSGANTKLKAAEAAAGKKAAKAANDGGAALTSEE